MWQHHPERMYQLFQRRTNALGLRAAVKRWMNWILRYVLKRR